MNKYKYNCEDCGRTLTSKRKGIFLCPQCYHSMKLSLLPNHARCSLCGKILIDRKPGGRQTCMSCLERHRPTYAKTHPKKIKNSAPNYAKVLDRYVPDPRPGQVVFHDLIDNLETPPVRKLQRARTWSGNRIAVRKKPVKAKKPRQVPGPAPVQVPAKRKILWQ